MEEEYKITYELLKKEKEKLKNQITEEKEYDNKLILIENIMKIDEKLNIITDKLNNMKEK